MRFPFKGTRERDEAMGDALDGLRYTLRSISRHQKNNPFARPVPSILAEEPRSAQIIRLY